MASVHSRETKNGVRYFVSYRDAAHKQHKTGSFRRKRDAQEAAARIEIELKDGTYVDPTGARATIGELADAWLERKKSVVRPTTYQAYLIAVENYVRPAFGNRQVNSVRRSDAQSWLNMQANKLSPGTLKRNYRVLRSIFDDAVEDGRIQKNPCNGIQLPKETPRRHTYLSATQVVALAEASEGHDTLVLTLGFCGLRISEARGLLVKNVDTERSRLSVERQLVYLSGKYVWGPTKTGSARTVAVPRHVMDAIAAEISCKGPDEFVFTEADGEHLRRPGGSWWPRALKAAGIEDNLTIHDLRHTAASLMVRSGANVKAVQRQLGHASAAMTLDVYADLFDDDLDAVAARMDAEIAAAIGNTEVTNSED